MIFSSYEVILDLLTLYYPSVTLELPYLSMIFMVIFYLYGVILCLCFDLDLTFFVLIVVTLIGLLAYWVLSYNYRGYICKLQLYCPSSVLFWRRF